jgi:hypothetical protein
MPTEGFEDHTSAGGKRFEKKWGEYQMAKEKPRRISALQA